MSLKHIDGFDQFQGQASQALLTSLQSAGYVVSNGLAMAPGRKPNGFALELQVSPGAGGATWSSRTNTAKANLRAVAANAQGRFVAVGDSGVALTSVDSISWAALVLGTDKNMRSIECNAGTFIAVGESGTILRSNDGQVWSARTSPIPAMNIADVACDGVRWLAVGANGNAGAIIVSDDDGMTWSIVVDNPGSVANVCVEYGDCWMVGGLNGQLLTSDSGLSFITRTFGAATTVKDLAFYNGTWLAASGRDVRRSLNKGVSWTVAASALGAANGELNSIKVSEGRWIVVGDFAVIFMSDDAATWVRPEFTGTTNHLYDVNISKGARVGWAVVGARGTEAAATATIYVSMAPPTTFSRSFTSASTRVVIGFAHRATARGRILSIANLLNVDWPAGIEILGVRGASVPIRNVDYYYEVEIDKTAGKVRLYVNDTLDLEAPLPAGAATMTNYALTWQAENGAVARLDDVYILDGDNTNGSTLTARLKPISIPIRLPDADALTEWTPSVAGQHWPLVGLLPPSNSSYVSSAESGKQDLFTSTKDVPADVPIIAVGVIALAQKSDLDNRQLGLVVGAPGNQKEVIDTTLSITSEYSYAVFETAPGNVPWDATNVKSTPFGIAVRP